MQRIRSSVASITRLQRCWPLGVVTLLCFLGSVDRLPAGEVPPAHLFRTAIHDRTVWAVSGRWLTIPRSVPVPVRAWSGILLDVSGGPHVIELRSRQRHATQRLVADISDSEERTARMRQLQAVRCRFFDVVLLEFFQPVRKSCWIVDYDIDQNLNFETQHWVAHPPSIRSASAMGLPFTTSARVPYPVEPASVMPAATSPAISTAAVPAVPQSTRPLQQRLMTLDAPHRRKRQLAAVVHAADALIMALESAADTIDVSDALADALYRRGRALGYMELPDVIAHTPVEDQAWLDREFEATYGKLASRVDMQGPQYVLLNIRRERRAGRRGRALDLVDIYADVHTHPVWKYKKRMDLFRELNAPLAAHQAAAELWLRAEKPSKPVCCIFSSSSATVVPPFADAALTGTALTDVVTEHRQLMLRRVGNGQQEAVAWIADTSLHDVRTTNWQLVSDDYVSTAHDHDLLVRVQRYTDVNGSD